MPRSIKRSCFKPLRLKIEAMDCARSLVNAWLAGAEPVASTWPSTSTAFSDRLQQQHGAGERAQGNRQQHRRAFQVVGAVYQGNHHQHVIAALQLQVAVLDSGAQAQFIVVQPGLGDFQVGHRYVGRVDPWPVAWALSNGHHQWVSVSFLATAGAAAGAGVAAAEVGRQVDAPASAAFSSALLERTATS